MDLPNIAGTSIDEVPIERCDVIPESAGATDGDRGILAAAYGAALGRMGTPFIRGHLRREELRHTGKFERLELPLAVLGLLAVTFFLVQIIFLQEKIKLRNYDLLLWLKSSNSYAILGNPAEGYPGYLKDPPEDLVQYCEAAQEGRDSQRTRFQQLQQVQARLNNYILQAQKDLGQSGEITQPLSALEGAALVLGVIDELGKDKVGRFSIRKLDVQFRKQAGRNPDRVEVSMDMTFFAPDTLIATEHWTNMRAAIQDQPWCVGEVEGRDNRNLSTGGGIYLDNIRIVVDPLKAEDKKAS